MLKIVGGVYWLLMFVCGVFLPKTSIFLTAAVAVGFILIGLYSKKSLEVVNRNFITALSCAIFCFTYIIHCVILDKNLDYSSCNFGIFPLFLTSSLAGSVFVIQVSKKLSHWNLLKFIGQKSLDYYGFHFLVLSVVGFVCEHFIKQVILQESIIFILTMVGTTIIVSYCEKLNKSLKGWSAKGNEL